MVDFFRASAAEYGRAIFIPIGQTRSQIYANALRAAFAVGRLSGATAHPEHQDNASDPFSIHVIDSQTLFTGEGILVYAAARARQQGMPYMQLVQYLQHLTRDVHSFLIPHDLYYLYVRAREKGDASIGLGRYLADKARDVKPIIAVRLGETEVVSEARGFEEALRLLLFIAAAKIKEGLRVPAVAISYAGDPSVIEALELYRDFVAMAQAHGVEILTSIMSPTGAVYVGPRALALSFISGYGRQI
jgi:fatty acid-binding protein DegV